MSRTREPGALAILLHTHMPYVEGFGTWPFGEEWLWEAIATSYLPLLRLLDEGAPIALSLTPILCDQLEREDIGSRFERFVCDVRRVTHAEDAAGLRRGGHPRLAAELERACSEYEAAADALAARGGELLAAFAPHAAWTSAATHAVLPLLATDAGVNAQVASGVRSHVRRFGVRWGGGFWLPECAHAAHLEPILLRSGARHCCVELTTRLGLGAHSHLRPLLSDSGLVLVPIDRQTISLVWSEDGYPAHAAYRDYHRHTVHHHNPWSNDGSAYDHAAALRLVAVHAADFVQRTRQRLAQANAAAEADGDPPPGGGLVVCALDTELLGHWWYEGVAWLAAVVEECERQGLPLVRIDDALQRIEPAPLSPLAGCKLPTEVVGAAPTSWGSDGDLSTWSGPQVADLAFAQREAELSLIGSLPTAGDIALRSLLALQASDWAFMISRGTAVPYARERFAAHRAGFELALEREGDADPGAMRNLAADATLELASP